MLGQGNVDLHTSQVGNVGNKPPSLRWQYTHSIYNPRDASLRAPNCRLYSSARPISTPMTAKVRSTSTTCSSGSVKHYVGIRAGPVAGVPADDMNFVSSADGKGCLIAVAIPGLKQAYMYRSVATAGDPWDRQCWQSIEDIISRCVQTGPNKGSVSGPNNGQYYEGGISWLNSEHPGGLTTTHAGQHLLPTEPNQPSPSPSTPPAFAFRPSPSCLPFAVENVPPQLVLSDSSLIDPNNLLFRIRQTLCTNTCGSIQGVPAEVMHLRWQGMLHRHRPPPPQPKTSIHVPLRGDKHRLARLRMLGFLWGYHFDMCAEWAELRYRQ